MSLSEVAGHSEMASRWAFGYTRVLRSVEQWAPLILDDNEYDEVVREWVIKYRNFKH